MADSKENFIKYMLIILIIFVVLCAIIAAIIVLKKQKSKQNEETADEELNRIAGTTGQIDNLSEPVSNNNSRSSYTNSSTPSSYNLSLGNGDNDLSDSGFIQ